jgi:C-terminal peptidase prc
MIGAALGLMLFAPTAGPVPTGPYAKPGGVGREEAQELALRVNDLVREVKKYYVRDVDDAELFEAAARGLYEEAGQAMPEARRRAIRQAAGVDSLVLALADARIALGRHPALEGHRAVVAAVGGFRHALDPYCGLTGRMNTYVSAEIEYGIGIELEGVTGPRWVQYELQSRGYTPGLLPAGKPEPVATPAPPATLPWTVKKVVPGSPAHRAGVLPGDVVTQVNGTAVDPASAPRLFAELVSGAPRLPTDETAWKVTLTRAGRSEPLTMSVRAEQYTPECVFGVVRQADGSWDYMLDAENRIGYIRLGAIEQGRRSQGVADGADVQLAEALAGLTRRRCRGLVLDLRWCPGGYVDEAERIAGMFLPDGAVIYRNESRRPVGARDRPVVRAGDEGSRFEKFVDVPIVVLVGSATIGGGELLAAALQDNGRAVVIGQRTVGKAVITTVIADQTGALNYRVTRGTTLRPNGKSRHRGPDSGPNDDWGIRPDPGHVVPVTADFTAELGRSAERQALRPGASREVLPFDDPVKDPFRLAALKYFREKLK